jgi:hypothetical protein
MYGERKYRKLKCILVGFIVSGLILDVPRGCHPESEPAATGPVPNAQCSGLLSRLEPSAWSTLNAKRKRKAYLTTLINVFCFRPSGFMSYHLSGQKKSLIISASNFTHVLKPFSPKGRKPPPDSRRETWYLVVIKFIQNSCLLGPIRHTPIGPGDYRVQEIWYARRAILILLCYSNWSCGRVQRRSCKLIMRSESINYTMRDKISPNWQIVSAYFCPFTNLSGLLRTIESLENSFRTEGL